MRSRRPAYPIPNYLEGRIQDLEAQLRDARRTIIHLMPREYAALLESYRECESTRTFYKWENDVVDKLIERVPQSSVIEHYGSIRANCPLCGSKTLGPFPSGFTLPIGLSRHLIGWGNTRQCSITEAAFGLGRDFVERRYGEAERSAKEAEETEKMRQMEARRKTDRLYQIHPFDPPHLVDEGYSSWFGKCRTGDQLSWAEARAVSLGFTRHIEGNVMTLKIEENEYIVYADVRIEKKIRFFVFKHPVKKTRRLRQAGFDFQDSWKYDIEEKFKLRLREALERL